MYTEYNPSNNVHNIRVKNMLPNYVTWFLKDVLEMRVGTTSENKALAYEESFYIYSIGV